MTLIHTAVQDLPADIDTAIIQISVEHKERILPSIASNGQEPEVIVSGTILDKDTREVIGEFNPVLSIDPPQDGDDLKKYYRTVHFLAVSTVRWMMEQLKVTGDWDFLDEEQAFYSFEPGSIDWSYRIDSETHGYPLTIIRK
ncbi:hypothetical protein QDX21_07000 [Auritidibacter ignavus]|uniref:Uncharacterized protein n=1 Tax=Auritidibacter ignavus TaxID=678932 RepID=A0AAJ6DBU5_9MICC|nr:hypothetical protein [Auritidibacter ignavus]WGH92082.1 hypothetical protein QDX21_07000 [Auritidibacter ignavus]